ncbi:MAG: NnrU family protein, partial [Acetobacteraceae bacterium]
MAILALAAVVWIGVHVGLSGTSLRLPIAAQLGERAFRALFSAFSIAALAFLVVAFIHAPREPLWV